MVFWLLSLWYSVLLGVCGVMFGSIVCVSD